MRKCRRMGGAGLVVALLAGVGALAVVSSSSGPLPLAQYDAEGDLVRPEGYRDWVLLGSSLTPNDMNDGAAPFPEFHHVYIHPTAWDLYKQTGECPDGTLIVKELMSAGEKIIFDTDSAFFNDDGAALSMLLGRKHADEVIGITVVTDNAWLEPGTEYVLHLLEYTGHAEIPVYKGAGMPLVHTPKRMQELKADWGAGCLGAFSRARETSREKIPPPFGGKFTTIQVREQHAADYLVAAINAAHGELTLFAAGPMTNIALALEKDPDIAKKLKRLVFVGGAVDVPGNTTVQAGFNMVMDPEAAQRVLAADIPEKVMFPLDVTTKTKMTEERLENLVRAKTKLTEILREDLGRCPGLLTKEKSKDWMYLWDCVAAAYLIDPAVATKTERMWVGVDTSDGPSYGATVASKNRKGRKTAPMDVLLDVDEQRFFEEIFRQRAGFVGTSPAARANAGQSDTLNCEEVVRILAQAQEPRDGIIIHPLSGKTLDGDFRCLGDEPRFQYFADFEGATFSGDVWLPHVIFEEGVSFQNVVFEGEADFYDARFPAGADFAGAEFRGNANFAGAQFNGHTEFQRANFRGRSDFGLAHFCDTAFFEEAEFAKSTSFKDTDFFRDADFSEVVFRDADFGRARFFNDARFADTAFKGIVSFRSARFYKEFVLSGSFSDWVTFAGSTIDRWNANKIRFKGFVDVTGVSVGEMSLTDSFFDDEVDFVGARFLGPVKWERVRFRRRADLRRATFSAPVHWSFVTSESLRLGWFSSKLAEHLEPWPVTREAPDSIETMERKTTEATESFVDVLTGLQAAFVEHRQFGDRNAVAAKIQDLSLEVPPAGWSELSRSVIWPVWKLAKQLTLGIPSRWGTDLLRVVLVSLALSATVFAGFMLLGSGIKAHSAERKPIEYGMRIRILERYVFGKKMADNRGGRIGESVSTRLAVALGITIRSFFKVGKGTTYRELSSAAMTWSRVSWGLGLFMLAHLIVAVKNTIPLVSLLFDELF